MLIIKYLVCMVRGHAFSTITYKASTYQLPAMRQIRASYSKWIQATWKGGLPLIAFLANFTPVTRWRPQFYSSSI